MSRSTHLTAPEFTVPDAWKPSAAQIQQMQQGIPQTRAPRDMREARNVPRMTPDQVAQMQPHEKKAAHVNICVAMLRRIETEVSQALVDAVQHGCVLEGKQVDHPAIEDIVALVISVNSSYLSREIRERWVAREQNVGFVLRDRATLSSELLAMRLPSDALEGMGNRAQRRAFAEQVEKHPWNTLGEDLKMRLFPGVPNCHYIVVLGDLVVGVTLPFKFDLEASLAALAKVKADREAEAAALVAGQGPAPALEAPSDPEGGEPPAT